MIQIHWLIFSSSSSFSSSDSAGFVQFISHRSRSLPLGGPLLPHTLLLLSPWWPERGIRGGGGGWRWQHRSWLQWEEGAGHLLRHVGGGGVRHAVLVRRRIFWRHYQQQAQTYTVRFLAVVEEVLKLLLKWNTVKNTPLQANVQCKIVSRSTK